MSDPFLGQIILPNFARVQRDLQRAGLSALGARQALRGDVISSKQDRLMLSKLLTATSAGIHRSIPEGAKDQQR